MDFIIVEVGDHIQVGNNVGSGKYLYIRLRKDFSVPQK